MQTTQGFGVSYPLGFKPNVGALIIRRGVWRILDYTYNKEPSKKVLVIIQTPVLHSLRLGHPHPVRPWSSSQTDGALVLQAPVAERSGPPKTENSEKHVNERVAVPAKTNENRIRMQASVTLAASSSWKDLGTQKETLGSGVLRGLVAEWLTEESPSSCPPPRPLTTKLP